MTSQVSVVRFLPVRAVPGVVGVALGPLPGLRDDAFLVVPLERCQLIVSAPSLPSLGIPNDYSSTPFSGWHGVSVYRAWVGMALDLRAIALTRMLIMLSVCLAARSPPLP